MTTQSYALIAEPDMRLLGLLLRIATDLGLTPVAVRDGAAAAEALRARGAPTILLTNLTLPRLDGFALLAELRRLAPPHEVAAVVLSDSLEMRAAAYDRRDQLGIAEIIAGKMAPGSIRSAIERALAAPASMPRPLTQTEPDTPSWRPERLSRIAAMGIVDDAPPDERLQRLVEETARTFGVPIALVSVVLEDRQWFKAHIGLSGEILVKRGTPISEAFCRHVVESESASPLVVPDATRHPVFAEYPLVLSGAVGSYAGAPLLTTQGDVLGTLCIVDSRPLSIDAEQVDVLVALARRVAGEIALQSRAHTSAQLVADLSKKLETERSRTRQVASIVSTYGAVLAGLEIGILLMDEERRILYANPALAEMVDLSQRDLMALTGPELTRHLASLAELPDEIYRQRYTLNEGPFLARALFDLARPRWRALRWESKPVEIVSGLAQLEVFTDMTESVNTVSMRAPGRGSW